MARGSRKEGTHPTWLDHNQHAAVRRRRFAPESARVAVGATCSPLVAAGAMAAVPAQGTTQPPRPTAITATASTDNAGLGGAVPQVLVEAGDPVDLTVTLQPTGAAYKFNTPLTLSASLESGDPTHGTLSPATVVMPAGANTATFSVTYSAVDNGVQITVTQRRTRRVRRRQAPRRRSTCSRS